MSSSFPGFERSFVWGVAASSYQIEGAATADGKGLGSWDVFCERPGNIFEGHHGQIACDHYHRLDEDLDLLARLGVDAYRLSISWPRVLPDGRGTPNDAGLAFYDRVVDGLLARGITPYVTLFHWDAPQALERLGGFRNPDCQNWFADYTTLMARRLGDRVRHFFTLNEPHAFIEGGLRHGRHAPGYTLPLDEVLRAAHHALLCHGQSTQVLRAEIKHSWVALAPVLVCAIPASDQPEDVEAARRFTFGPQGDVLRITSFWCDPAFGLGYPEEVLREFAGAMPKVSTTDLDVISQPLDAFGCNLYDAPVVQASSEQAWQARAWPPGTPRTAFGWPVTPAAHYWGPRFVHERYGAPVLITENGLSCRDVQSADGSVHDPERLEFIQAHLHELHRAAEEGIPVLGYFHWSLMDNFEWNHGFRERFGLIHVDFESLERTPKDSFFGYRELILAHKGRAF